MENYKRLTSEELGDFIQRVSIQLEPTLTQQLISVVLELGQYRDKIEQGSMIELPCKVGSTVYRATADKRIKQPHEFRVTGFWCSTYKNCNEIHLAHYIDNKFMGSITVSFSEFNKTLFLTKEAAKAKMKELQNKGE